MSQKTEPRFFNCFDSIHNCADVIIAKKSDFWRLNDGQYCNIRNFFTESYEKTKRYILHFWQILTRGFTATP